jgi:hypothetical protein
VVRGVRGSKRPRQILEPARINDKAGLPEQRVYRWMFAQHLAHLAGAGTPCACNEKRSDHAITLPCDQITDELFSNAPRVDAVGEVAAGEGSADLFAPATIGY